MDENQSESVNPVGYSEAREWLTAAPTLATLRGVSEADQKQKNY